MQKLILFEWEIMETYTNAEEELDAAILFARNIEQVKYKDIPPETVKFAKMDILDTLGVIIAGSTALGCRELVELVKEWDGKEQSTVIAYGYKVPAPFAALANGAMGHALDYDDTYDAAAFHAGVPVICGCLAVAEQMGTAVSGKEFITAVTLGVDLMARMAVASTKGTEGWHHTAVLGFFGSAAACARLLELDEVKITDALGLAYSQAAGNFGWKSSGALSKRMQAGFAAKGGALSALMAERGITGARNSLEGRNGFYQVYHRGAYDRAILIDDLGKRFEIANISFKPWPCCRVNHPYLTATFELLREREIQPQDVEEIIVYGGKLPIILCDPLDIKRKPRNSVDSQFSIPYSVSTAIAKKRLVIEDFTEKAIKDDVVLRLAQRVVPRLDPSLATGAVPSAIVEIRLKSGESLKSRRIDFSYGHPNNPMTDEDFAMKFKDCASHSVKPLPDENLGKVVKMVNNLEAEGDIKALVQLIG